MKSTTYVMMLIFFSWLYIGVAQDAFYEESHNVFFIKKYPTLKINFLNPTLTESDVPPIQDWNEKNKKWDLNTKKELIDYCKYRFGIVDISPQSLGSCSQRPYLSDYVFLNWPANFF
ncbi:hypothetical protein RGU70_00610 [Herbaspirillum sp. RTI4]|uniref:hypothetical protein n=1 Tax=Herbaspirillum sp. RTI4 TaxID=3048640 RepID=UPI002AB4ABEC|nr:hypothetical protein [Herbaspirillum sp. RTI4]MDY7576828.1 hypothetical protein [Herbaspirillum sp. RTI4]MEA9981424.1 hypothetical protein [Herbaspirillum sp. RTI4]